MQISHCKCSNIAFSSCTQSNYCSHMANCLALPCTPGIGVGETLRHKVG